MSEIDLGGSGVNEFNWKSIDLNLLVAFMALYETGSVTGAAERVFVSQSAMSHSLAKLRELMGDRLFERKGHKMQPTERADQVAPIIQKSLTQLQMSVFTTEEFNPTHYQGTCKIGLTDYAELIFAPILFDAISQVAPQSRVSFVHANRHNYQQLLTEENVDVMIGSFPALDSSLSAEKIYTEKHVCMFDPTKVSLSSPFRVEEFVQYPHALVSPDGHLKTQVDEMVGELGLNRRVAVASRNFLTIRHLIAGRALLCIVPELMAKIDLGETHLSSVEPPLPIADFDISLIYRKGVAHTEKNQWLRELVHDSISSVVEQP